MFSSKKTRAVRNRQPAGRVNETFRRNNVIISRRQSEITARQQSVTQRQLQKKQKESRHRLKLRIVTTVFLIGTVVGLWRMAITTTNVQAQNGQLSAIESEKYTKTINQVYYSHTLFGQSWLLDGGAFEQAVIAKHPEIATIEPAINTPLSTTLTATITFRKPVFTWKDASKTERYIDNKGMLFSINKDRSVDPKKLIHIEDESGAVLEAGSSVLTATLIQFIGQLHTELPALFNAPIARVVIPRSTREVQVQMAKTPYLIKFNSQREVGEVVGELKSLVAFLKQDNITPSTYIDMRIANKAYYK
jgi:cell division septal protein FtsQ